MQLSNARMTSYERNCQKMINILKNIPAANEELVKQLAQCSVATVHEALGQIGALDSSIKPLIRDMKMCGRAITVKCFERDNIMLIKAISMAKRGDVIIADMGSCVNEGPFGEVLAVDALTHGVAGLVVNCSVRDSEAVIRRGFPVFSAGLSVRGTSKATLGTINHPISIGGITVYPGDYVLGDADGVVVIPHDRIKEAIEKSVAREEKEAKVMERLQAGESLFDIYDYQKVFDRLGCKEE